MTTRTFADPLVVILCALAAVAPAGAQSRALDVRARLDAARWPAARATYAGVDWRGAAAAAGLDVVSTDARPLDRGGALVRLGAASGPRWLVRIAVVTSSQGIATSDVARRAFLQWVQPIQGALVRADRAFAIADVVLVDEAGGRTRAGFVAGNVAVWVAATSSEQTGALDVLRAFAGRLVTHGPTEPELRLVAMAQRDAGTARRAVRAIAPSDAVVEIDVEGGHVAHVERDVYDIVLARPAVGGRAYAGALDPLGRVLRAEIALTPIAR